MIVFLIGIMGAGKTTLGSALAKKLKVPFVDTDTQIEKQEHCSIAKIFSSQGENYFRELESQELQKIADEAEHALDVDDIEMVVAVGGGAVLKASNIALMQSCGKVVHIKREMWLIQSSIDTKNRPLLSSDPKELNKIYQQRKGLYKQAAHEVVFNDDSIDSAVVRIIHSLKQLPNKYV